MLVLGIDWCIRAVWASEQFDWLTLTTLWLHITLMYLLWCVQVAHIAWIYLLWWSRLIHQQFVVNWSSSGRCISAHFTSSDAASDGFIKLQFEKIAQAVAETVLKFLVLSDLIELIGLRIQASLIFYCISKKCISWLMLTKFQQGRQSRVRVGPVVCYWITGFYESEWKAGGKRKDLKID